VGFWNWLGFGSDTAEERSGLQNPQGWMFDSFSTTPSPSGQRVTVDKALSLSPVWAAVQIIAEQIGQLPLKVYSDVDGDRVLATQHRSWRLLHDKPNDFTPAGRFWSTVSVHLMLWGNAFIRKYRNEDGLVEELYLLAPGQVAVKWDPQRRIKSFRFEPTDGRPREEFSTDEVLHIFGMSLDGLIGESVIRCKAALGAAIARDEFEGTFYKKGAVIPQALEHPNKLSPEAAKNLSQTFEMLYGGSGKSHGTPVLEEGMQIKQIGSPLRDLMFVEAQQLTRTDIATMFGLPPSYLGGSTGDSLTYATVEGNQIQFATHAIAPRTVTIAKALTWDPGILPQNIFDCEFTLEALMRGDATSRGAFYKAMSEVKAITPNEIRQRENMPPIEGGDKSPAKAEPVPPQLALPGMPTVPANENGTPQDATPAAS
jgi:HK97 family phage portal protein